MKKYLKTIFLVILALILTACSSRNQSENLHINFKADKSSNLGYSAVVYGDRIYYVSNELRDAGIYSMNMEGSDVRLEVKNPSITMLEINNDILYFDGLLRIDNIQATIQTDTKNKHALYFCPLGDNSVQRFKTFENNINVMGFYVSEKGYGAISYGAGMEFLALFDIDQDRIERTEESVKKTTREFLYKNSKVLKDIYVFGNLIIISDHYYDDNRYDFYDCPNVLDSETGELVLRNNDGFYQIDFLKAFFMDEKNIYCSYNEMVVVLDRVTYDVKSTFIPEGINEEYSIDDMEKVGDNVYIIANKWKDIKYKGLPLINEKLYKVDNTFACNEVMNLGSNQRILGFYEDYIILFDKVDIYKMKPGGSQEDKEKITEVPSDINTQPYTIDYAGDWMFVYKTYPEYNYDSELPGQQLLYKINMETGEVIKNDVKLDFSVLDNFKEK